MLVHHAARLGADVWQTYGRCFTGMAANGVAPEAARGLIIKTFATKP